METLTTKAYGTTSSLFNDAFDKTQDEEVRFRYVIDIQSLKDAQ